MDEIISFMAFQPVLLYGNILKLKAGDLMEIITGKKKSLIGMVHVPALPGTPAHHFSISEIIDLSLKDAQKLDQSGFDAIMIENMNDRPYLKKEVGPEITAAMTAIAKEIKKAVQIPLGVQILAGANKEAIAVAKASGAQFIRAEGFVFAHTADEGIIESDAGELLRFRKAIGAEEIKIFTDIKKKAFQPFSYSRYFPGRHCSCSRIFSF